MHGYIPKSKQDDGLKEFTSDLLVDDQETSSVKNVRISYIMLYTAWHEDKHLQGIISQL